MLLFLVVVVVRGSYKMHFFGIVRIEKKVKIEMKSIINVKWRKKMTTTREKTTHHRCIRTVSDPNATYVCILYGLPYPWLKDRK